MKILMRRSGLTRQTIHFYLRKGLLPKPLRTSRTFALYPPETLDLLELVKHYQDELRLSLGEIVQLFSSANYDPGRIREDMSKRGVVSAAAGSRGPGIEGGCRFISRSELLAGLRPLPPEGWIEDVHRRGLVHGRRDKYSPERVALVRALWDACQAGINVEVLENLSRRIEDEAETELIGFRESLAAKRMAANNYPDAIGRLEVIDRFVLSKRRDAVSASFFKVFGATDRITGANQRRVIPSETFFVRMGLNKEIDRLLNLLDRNPLDMRSLTGLARAYNLRCDWLLLCDVSERILHIDPENVRAIADKTRAMHYLGTGEEATAILEHAVRTGNDPLLKFRLGQSLVLRAQGAGLAEFLRAVSLKESLTAEALRAAANEPSIRRWILLDRALDNLSLSDPLRLNQPSVQEVEALYAEYEAIPEKGLSRLSAMGLIIGRTLAGYALYLLYRNLGMSKAERIRRKLVQIDPHCILAGRSEPRPSRAITSRAKVAAIPSSAGRKLKRAV